MDGVRREQVRNPMQVPLNRYLPSGRLVLVFLHGDLPLGGRGQVRLVVGELVAWLWADMDGARSVRFGGSSSMTSSCRAGAPNGNAKGTGSPAPEGGAEALPGPRTHLPPTLAQHLGRGGRNR